MTIEDLSELHNVQLSMMDSIHDICVKNKLTYYIIAGTCLGAVRHKGFIPWDVDIDIAMPRKDYDDFLNKYSCQLPSNLICKHYKICRHFKHPHALICLKDSILYSKYCKLNKNNENEGIFIDLFPLDQCPNDKKLQYKQEKEILRIKKIRGRKMSLVFENNNKFVILIKKIIRNVLKVIPYYYLNKVEDKLIQRYDFLNDCKYWCSMTSGYSYNKQCILKSIYGTPKLVDFDGHLYYAPEQKEEYLKHLYGNYMTPPAITRQNEMMNLWIYASWYEGLEKKEIKSN